MRSRIPLSCPADLFQTRQNDCQVGAGALVFGRQHRGPCRRSWHCLCHCGGTIAAISRLLLCRRLLAVNRESASTRAPWPCRQATQATLGVQPSP